MNLDIIRQKRAINNRLVGLTEYLANKQGITREAAFLKLIRTRTYTTLLKPKAKLYCESLEYIEDMLEAEFRGDWDYWLML